MPAALLLLAPSIVVLGMFVVYPLIRAIVLGSQRCDIQGGNCHSNGWDQYVDVFRSVEFQHALWATFKLALITVPLGLALGVGLAVGSAAAAGSGARRSPIATMARAAAARVVRRGRRLGPMGSRGWVMTDSLRLAASSADPPMVRCVMTPIGPVRRRHTVGS